jgi:hypothetical protein
MPVARRVVEPRALAIGAVLGLGVLCGYGLAGRDEATITAKRVEIVDEAGNAKIVLGMVNRPIDPVGLAYGIDVRAAKVPFDGIKIRYFDQDIAILSLAGASPRTRIWLGAGSGPRGVASLHLSFPDSVGEAVEAKSWGSGLPYFRVLDREGTVIFAVPKKE